MSEQLWASVGGTKKVYNPTRAFSTFVNRGDEYWDFGWIPPHERTEQQEQRHDDAVKGMAPFVITGNSREAEPSANLTLLWKHPTVSNALGYAYSGTHQLTGSCFPAGTMVRMADGSEKAIEDIVLGDEVFAHTGQKRKVVRVFRRKYSGTMHTFHVKGWRFPVTMTHDHDCLVCDPKESHGRWEFGRFVKKKAKDVGVGERFLLPSLADHRGAHKTYDMASLPGVEPTGVNRCRVEWREFAWEGNRVIKLDEQLAWVLGLYLAEGTLRHNKVFFHLNPTTKAGTADKLEESLRSIFGSNLSLKRQTPKATVLQIVVHDGRVARLFAELIPGNTYSKRVPGDVLNSPRSVRMSAIRGWIAGDGHFQTGAGKRGVSIRGVTACEGLARDMGALALSCGMRPSVLRRKKAPHQRVASLDVYFNGTDALQTCPERSGEVAIKARPKLMERTPYGYATVVERIDKESVTDYPVYCCEVEEEHSLVVNGVAQHQCVGAGGGNVAASLNFKEVVKDAEPEKVILPFYPYTYGRSRFHMGDMGPGEGSLGSMWAKAAEQDGVLDNLTHLELPKPNNSDALVWGSSVEMSWSAGGRSPCKDWVDKGKQYPIKTVSELKSASDVRKSLLNYYPVTEASMYGFNARVEKDVLVGRRGPRWAHQMSFHGFWDHPDLGPIYLLMNQWGLTAHGRDPSGHCPGGGVWIPESDVDWICRSGDGEVYSFSGYQGYPAPDFVIPWIF